MITASLRSCNVSPYRGGNVPSIDLYSHKLWDNWKYVFVVGRTIVTTVPPSDKN